MPNPNLPSPDKTDPPAVTEPAPGILATDVEAAAAAAAARTAAAGSPDLAKVLEEAGMTVVTKEDGTSTLAATVKVDGEERVVMIDDLRTNTSKVAGADKLMAAASVDSKKAANALHVMGLLEQTRDESLDENTRLTAFRELAVAMGDSAESVNIALEQLRGSANAPAAGKTPDGDAKSAAPQPIAYDQLPQKVQQLVAYAEEKQLEEQRNKIFSVVEKSVDDDPILGKLDDGARTHLRTLAMNDTQRRVVVLKETFSADMVASVLETLRPLALLISKGNASPPRADGTADLEGAAAEMVRIYPELLTSLPSGSAADGVPGLQATPESGQRGSPAPGSGDSKFKSITDPGWVEETRLDVMNKMRKLAVDGQASSLNR